MSRCRKKRSRLPKKERPRKMCQQYNGEGARPYLRDQESLSQDEEDKQLLSPSRKKNGKILPPKLKTSFKGGFELGSGGGKGLQYEQVVSPTLTCIVTNIVPVPQVSIDENYPGLVDCLTGGRPYSCVVPSCNQRTYPNMGSMRQHYVRCPP